MAEYKPEIRPEPIRSSCVSTSEHSAAVNIAVRLRPEVTVHAIATECCGGPEVRHCFRPGTCCNNIGCDVLITQPILIKLSLEYGADAHPGQPSMDCRRIPIMFDGEEAENPDPGR